MKKVLPRVILLMLTTILSLTTFAQEGSSKKSSKELTEKGSRGDLIIGKKEQKKSLKAAPARINKLDSVAPAPKKSDHKTQKSTKQK